MKTVCLGALAGLLFLSLVSAGQEKPNVLLPLPAGEKIYTFREIEEQKSELKNKIVRIELARLLGDGSDLLGNGTARYIAKDTSKTATPYGQVAFPREGLQKTGLADNPQKGPLALYVRVHLFDDKKAAAICIAVGTDVSTADGKASYSW